LKQIQNIELQTGQMSGMTLEITVRIGGGRVLNIDFGV